jgi:hypothetical protein
MREAFEVLKEFAPLSPEQAAACINELGGLKKMTLEIYEATKRTGDAELAAKILAEMEERSKHSNPEIARVSADILSSLKLEA